MKQSAYFVAICIFALAHTTLADDQQKLKRELTKITAMATDATGPA